MKMIRVQLAQFPDLFQLSNSDDLSGSVIPSTEYFPEEDRSKQPSLFSLIRVIRDMFASSSAGQLGLYGAFGYDLTFQFEPIRLQLPRDSNQRDLVMYLPDELLVVDNQRNDAWTISYEFTDERSRSTTEGLDRCEGSIPAPYTGVDESVQFQRRDTKAGEFSASVLRAKEEFRVGNLFEVVLSQTFRERLKDKPSNVFER